MVVRQMRGKEGSSSSRDGVRRLEQRGAQKGDGVLCGVCRLRRATKSVCCCAVRRAGCQEAACKQWVQLHGPTAAVGGGWGPNALTLEEVLVDLPAVLLGDQHLAWWVGVLKRVGSRPTRLPWVSAAGGQHNSSHGEMGPGFQRTEHVGCWNNTLTLRHK
jgi:hypothetical protein